MEGWSFTALQQLTCSPPSFAFAIFQNTKFAIPFVPQIGEHPEIALVSLDLSLAIKNCTIAILHHIGPLWPWWLWFRLCRSLFVCGNSHLVLRSLFCRWPLCCFAVLRFFFFFFFFFFFRLRPYFLTKLQCILDPSSRFHWVVYLQSIRHIRSRSRSRSWNCRWSWIRRWSWR